MCVCVYVYVYICMYVCLCVFIYIYIYITFLMRYITFLIYNTNTILKDKLAFLKFLFKSPVLL